MYVCGKAVEKGLHVIIFCKKNRFYFTTETVNEKEIVSGNVKERLKQCKTGRQRQCERNG
jgi:hypothetical protein